MPGKLRDLKELKDQLQEERQPSRPVVFTNGCFDLLHAGHVHLLREAKKLGDVLIVALNSDASVRKIKGPHRPIRLLAERAELVGSLEMVDYVTWFDETDPRRAIEELRPDVLVKGGDWARDNVVGADLVERHGGKVRVIPYLEGYSTTQLIERIRQA